MKADAVKLQALMISAKRFIIPEYQRPYCWTLDEVEQLWNDLRGAFEDYVGRGQPSEGEDYFLGSVVVANTTDSRSRVLAHVIDGQQRLTTLHTLLWIALRRLDAATEPPSSSLTALCRELRQLLLTTSDEPTLVAAKADSAIFLAVREGTPLETKRELGANAGWLREKVAQLSVDELYRFVEYVLYQTTFVLVQADSFAAAWDLFIGLNGKGRPLTPADLIKAFVCGSTADSAEMAGIWESKVLPLKNDATSALLDVLRVGTGRLGSEAKLFKDFEKAWKSAAVTASLLSDGALVYWTLWHQPVDHIFPGSLARRVLRGLRSLERRDHTPVLLALAARFGLAAALRVSLLQALEAYQLWMAIRSKRGRERDFVELAGRIYSQKAMTEADALAEIRALLQRLAPSAAEVTDAVASAAYRGRVMLFIVRQYEEGQRGDVRIDDVQYEHLMPQTPTEYWYAAAGTKEDLVYSRLVNNIGNIVPLDAATNIVGSNDDWPTKSALYQKNVPNWLAASLARSTVQWTPTHIHERAKAISQWSVTARWNLPQVLTQLSATP